MFMEMTRYWILAAISAGVALAAAPDPVQWSLSSDAAKVAPGSTVTLRLTAKIDSGWHLYSLDKTADIIPTTISLPDNPAVESFMLAQPKPLVKPEPILGHDVAMFFDQAVFLVQAKLKPDAPAGDFP